MTPLPFKDTGKQNRWLRTGIWIWALIISSAALFLVIGAIDTWLGGSDGVSLGFRIGAFLYVTALVAAVPSGTICLILGLIFHLRRTPPPLI